MGWETRGNGTYYYRKVRRGGRVTSEYVGAGFLAEALAGIDEIDAMKRESDAAAWRATVEDEQRRGDELAAVDTFVKSAVEAVMIANGYHTHKRQWRKAR